MKGVFGPVVRRDCRQIICLLGFSNYWDEVFPLVCFVFSFLWIALHYCKKIETGTFPRRQSCLGALRCCFLKLILNVLKLLSSAVLHSDNNLVIMIVCCSEVSEISGAFPATRRKSRSEWLCMS